jgi:hypothetical protein
MCGDTWVASRGVYSPRFTAAQQFSDRIVNGLASGKMCSSGGKWPGMDALESRAGREGSVGAVRVSGVGPLVVSTPEIERMPGA